MKQPDYVEKVPEKFIHNLFEYHNYIQNSERCVDLQQHIELFKHCNKTMFDKTKDNPRITNYHCGFDYDKVNIFDNDINGDNKSADSDEYGHIFEPLNVDMSWLYLIINDLNNHFDYEGNQTTLTDSDKITSRENIFTFNLNNDHEVFENNLAFIRRFYKHLLFLRNDNENIHKSEYGWEQTIFQRQNKIIDEVFTQEFANYCDSNFYNVLNLYSRSIWGKICDGNVNHDDLFIVKTIIEKALRFFVYNKLDIVVKYSHIVLYAIERYREKIILESGEESSGILDTIVNRIEKLIISHKGVYEYFGKKLLYMYICNSNYVGIPDDEMKSSIFEVSPYINGLADPKNTLGDILHDVECYNERMGFEQYMVAGNFNPVMKELIDAIQKNEFDITTHYSNESVLDDHTRSKLRKTCMNVSYSAFDVKQKMLSVMRTTAFVDLVHDFEEISSKFDILYKRIDTDLECENVKDEIVLELHIEMSKILKIIIEIFRQARERYENAGKQYSDRTVSWIIHQSLSTFTFKFDVNFDVRDVKVGESFGMYQNNYLIPEIYI